MGEIRNQLKSQNLGALLPAGIEQVGSQIFPDAPSIDDQLAFAQIIRAWASVHNPTFGTPIGSTGATTTKDGSETLLQLSKVQVAKLINASFSNAGGAPLELQFFINNVPIALDSMASTVLAVNAGETLGVNLGGLVVDANLPVSVGVASGTASDLTTELNYILTSQ